MLAKIPRGYRVAYKMSYTTVQAAIVEWSDYTGTGILFWNDFITRKSLRLPFTVEQVVSPDYRTKNLFAAIRKGLGAEFTPLIKEEMKLADVPNEITNEMLPHLLKIRIPGIDPTYDTRIMSSSCEPLKSFLLRREDLLDV